MSHSARAVFCKGLGFYCDYYYYFLIRKALRLITSLSALVSDILSSLIH